MTPDSFNPTKDTDMTEIEFNAMVSSLEADAREIMEQESDLIVGFEGFLMTMWSDDHDMNQRGATREEYEEALREVYARLCQ